MTRSSALFSVLFSTVLLLLCSVHSSDACRKLLTDTATTTAIEKSNNNNKEMVNMKEVELEENTRRMNIEANPSLDERMILAALPKGTKVPPSAPSKKGHAMIIDEKLFTLHIARIDRILRSVPSPGVGH